MEVYNNFGMKTNIRTVSTPRGAAGWFAEIHKVLDEIGAGPSKHQSPIRRETGWTIEERAKLDDHIRGEVDTGQWSS